MIRIKNLCLLTCCVAMFGCGATSTPKTVTGTWQAVMTSTTAQAGQQGEQAILLVSLQQSGTALTATVNNVLQESSCFVTGTVKGTTLQGKVVLPGGEAISNLQLTGSLGSSVATTLKLIGSMQSDANSGGGLFSLTPDLSGCAIGTGSFQMTRSPML